MSKKIRYNDVKVVKRRKKLNIKGFGIFIICALCLTGVILVSSVFSGALTVGNLSNLFKRQTDIKINAHSYYMVTMGQYDNKSQAENVASGAISLGAGAYIWEMEKKFFVVGNVYKLIDEANSVKNNITDTSFKIDVVEIPFKKISVIEKNYTEEQKEAVLNAIKFFDTVFTDSYDYSIKIDKKEVNNAYVSNELNSLKSEAKLIASKLDAINSVCVNEKAIHIKNSYILLIDALDTAVLKVINGKSVNRDLKYLTSCVANIKYNLYLNIC